MDLQANAEANGAGSKTPAQSFSTLGDLLAPGVDVSIEPARPTKKRAHIRDLPHEILLRICNHITNIDMNLERLGALCFVCRNFYILTHDASVWRHAAKSIWKCTVLPDPWTGWRQMCTKRQRILFHGIYITR